MSIEQSGAGDASMIIGSSQSLYTIGIDNSDSNIFKISHDGAVVNETVKITESGLIGINVDGTPTNHLEIHANNSDKVSADSPMFLIRGTGSNDAAIAFATDDQTLMMGIDNSDSDKFKISDDSSDLANNTRVTLDNSGDYAIGGSDPAGYKINVTGSFYSDDGDIITDYDTSGSGTTFLGTNEGSTSIEEGLYFYENGSAYTTVYDSHSNMWFNVDSNNSDADNNRFIRYYRQSALAASGTLLMLVEDTGYLGIATTNPDSELHVVGSLRVVDGNEAAGRILVSDTDGVGAWKSSGNSLPGNLACTGTGSTTSNGHCYKRFTGQSFTFGDAAAFCAAWGGYLVQITSSGEETTVSGITSGNFLWIGLHDMANEGDFRWLVDHTDDSGYSNWLASHPDDSGGAECVEKQGTGSWNDISCSTLRGWICERDNV